MGAVRLGVEAASEPTLSRKLKAPIFAPAGQSTQMIIGADAASDGDILERAEGLYGAYGLRRVYYSAFSPIPDASSSLPPTRPPLMREHRLYQADWLMRFYGFSRQEIVDAHPGGMLDIGMDPKLAWALANRDRFPIDVNRADREWLLRTPGLGEKTVNKILSVRRLHALSLADLGRLAGSVRRLKAFVVTTDWRPTAILDTADLAQRLRSAAKPANAVQLSLL